MPKDDFSGWVLDGNKDLFNKETQEEQFSDIVKFSKTARKMV